MEKVIKQIDYQLIEYKIATPKGSCFSGDLLWRQGKDKSEMQTVELKSLAKSTDEYDLYDYANKMVPEWELHDQAYIEAQEQAKEQEKNRANKRETSKRGASKHRYPMPLGKIQRRVESTTPTW